MGEHVVTLYGGRVMAAAFASDHGHGLGASVVLGASVIEADSSAAIVVPDADLLFNARLSRSGPDLVLTGTDGRHCLVPGYFASEHPPALVAPNGARLPADVIGLMAGSPAHGEYAQLQPIAPPDGIGKVEKLVGDATVIRNGVSVTLHVGDAVYRSDVIETGSDSKVGIGFPDGTALELLANTRMALNEYSYDPNGHANSALFTYVEGTFGFFAGKVAHTGDMKIATPIATMGIRGTTGVHGHGIDANGHDFYWQSIYDDPGTNISGSWDDFRQNPDGTTYVEVTVSQPGEMTVFTLQGPGLPPLITTIPIPALYAAIGQEIIEELTEIIQLLNVTPHSLPGSQGSPENPYEVLPPEFIPTPPGNGPQLIFYVPINVPGGPPEIVPIVLPPPPGTQTGFIWPSGVGTWDTPPGWIGHQVPTTAIDKVTIESGKVTYGNRGADNYVIDNLIVDAPAKLEIHSGLLNIQDGLDDGGTIAVGGDSPSLTVNGKVAIEPDGKLIARGCGAVIDLTLAAVGNSGTIAARHGGYVELIADAVTNEATGKFKSVGPGTRIDFTGVTFDNAGHVVAKDCGAAFFVNSSVDNEAGGRIAAKDFGSITFSKTEVYNYGQIRAVFGGLIKFEGLVTNETGGSIRSAGCDSCIVFAGDELDNFGLVTAVRGGTVKFFDGTIVNEAATMVAPGGEIDAKDCGIVKIYGGSVANGPGALVEAKNHGTVAIDNAVVLNTGGKFEATDCGSIVLQGCEGSVVNNGGDFVAKNFGAIVFDAVSCVVNGDGGKIEAEHGGRVIFDGIKIANDDGAKIEATGDCSVVSIDCSTVNNNGVLEAKAGGRIVIAASIVHNAGGDIEAAGCGSTVDLIDATIRHGTLETSHGGAIETVCGNSTFDGVTVADGSFILVGDGTTLTLQGVIHNGGVIDVDEADTGAALIVDGTVTLNGHGAVMLDGCGDAIVGGGCEAALDNVNNAISGFGEIGSCYSSLELVNESKGIVDADIACTTLTIDTGQTVVNGGLLEATNFGVLHIVDDVCNSGTLEANGGTLSVCGDVGGCGSVLIGGGGLADFIGAFDQDVTFAGAGTLELHVLPYCGTVTGFAAGDAIDLASLAYCPDETAIWSQSGDGGTLQIFDGETLEDTLNIAGTYVQTDFALTQDHAAGTKVVFAIDDIWTNNSGGPWNVAANWTDADGANIVPDATLDAVIDQSGRYAVTTSDPVVANALTIGDHHASLTGSGTVSIPTIDNDGTIDASGGTLTIVSIFGIANEGTLEASRNAELVVDGQVDNTGGLIKVDAGSSSAVFADAVSGGNATVTGGTLEFHAASSVTVTFDNGDGDTPKYGVLALDDAAAFTGQIAGFAGTGAALNESDAIDLAGFRAGKTSLVAVDDATDHVTTVTVTDTKDGLSASLKFDGDFTTADFALKGDGHGGSYIFDPPPSGAASSSVAIGGPDGDRFIFHPELGVESSVNFDPQQSAGEPDHSADAQPTQQLAALLASDTHGDMPIDIGNHHAIMPGMTAADLHAVLQTAVHLH
jgi:FecR protein